MLTVGIAKPNPDKALGFTRILRVCVGYRQFLTTAQVVATLSAGSTGIA